MYASLNRDGQRGADATVFVSTYVMPCYILLFISYYSGLCMYVGVISLVRSIHGLGWVGLDSINKFI